MRIVNRSRHHLPLNNVNQILETLTDSLIWDSRTFHEDPDIFSETYNPYSISFISLPSIQRIYDTSIPYIVRALYTKFRFTTTGGKEHITSQILQRLEEHGWDATRIALNLTVR